MLEKNLDELMFESNTMRNEKFARAKKIDIRLGNPSDPRSIQLGHNAVSFGTAELLMTMAIRGIYPDGTFSDNECCMWETMRSILRKEGKI